MKADHLANIQETLVMLANKLNDLKVDWLLGSSCSLMVQGVDVIPHDIDIITSPNSINTIKSEFSSFITNEEPDWIQLTINSIEVEFLLLPNITFPKSILYKGTQIPVNSLEEELYWYNKRGKEDMAKLIEDFLAKQSESR